MPKTRAKTFFGAGDYGREHFNDIVRSLYGGNPPKGVTWAKFIRYMEETPEAQKAEHRAQNEATDILYGAFEDEVKIFAGEDD